MSGARLRNRVPGKRISSGVQIMAATGRQMIIITCVVIGLTITGECCVIEVGY